MCSAAFSQPSLRSRSLRTALDSRFFARRSLGAHELGRIGKGLALQPPNECSLRHVDMALKELVHLTPELKKKVVEACTACIAYDRYVTDTEAELLRAVSAALECPMPPFIPGMEIGG